MLTFSDTEEKAVEKAIAALADMIPLEAVQLPHSPALTFPGNNNRITAAIGEDTKQEIGE